jgi:archaellum biogenesis protein FlaJ (TadC family)
MRFFIISLPLTILLVILINLFDQSTAINILILSLIFHGLGYLYTLLEEERKVREIDKFFPVFLKNLSRNIGAKVPMIKALIETSKQKYGNLTDIFHVFARKIESGIPITQAFNFLIEKFRDNTKVKNSLTILRQSFLSGYGLKESIDGIANYNVKIGEVEKERRGLLSQYIVLFYAITLIFLVITVAIMKVVIPVFSSFSENMKRQGQIVEIPCEFTYGFRDILCKLYENEIKLFKKEYNVGEYYLFGVLFSTILLQSFFAGIIIGIGIEKSLIKGLIHSLILFSITFFVFLLLGKLGIL